MHAVRRLRIKEKPLTLVADRPVEEYDCGESGSEFKIPLSELQPEAKLNRVLLLWRKSYQRAKAAGYIKIFFHSVLD